MDWSKAKNILIAALIAANLFIGAKYWQVRTEGEEARVRSAFLTGEYLQSLGVDLQCELPADETRLPVLFVEIEPEDASTQDPVTRDGTRVVLIGSSGQRAVPKSFGDNKGLVVSASSAAKRLVSRFSDEELDGLRIDGAELVYLVDRTGLSASGGQDTAVPAWLFTTNLGGICVDAYAN